MSSSNIASPYGGHTPLSSTNLSLVQGSSPDYDTLDHTYHDSIDESFLSSHKASRHLSNSASPSELDTPAHLPSETYGEYASYPELHDPYLGFDFGTPGRELDEDEAIVSSIEKQTPGADTQSSETVPVVVDTHSDSEVTNEAPRAVSQRPPPPPTGGNMNSQSTGSLNVPSDMASTPTGDNDASRGYMGASPRVVLTEWNSSESHELSASTNYRSPVDNLYGPQGDGYFMNPANASYTNPHMQIDTSSTGVTVSSEDHDVSRAGLDPNQRHAIGQAEIPNFQDQEKKDEIDARIAEVEHWMSQATIQEAGAYPRPTTADQRDLPPNPPPGGEAYVGIEIEDVSFEASFFDPRHNKVEEGQLYFNRNGGKVTDDDIALLSRPRHLHDPVVLPLPCDTEHYAGLTVNEIVQKYSEQFDNHSVFSRTATWGTTRRRSEPADIENFTTGSMFKELAISQNSDKKPNIFAKVGQIVRKRSVGASNKLKRNRSDAGVRGRVATPHEERAPSAATLAPPPRSPSGGRVRPQSPRLQTSFGDALTPGEGGGHSRRASLSAMSPKVGGFINNISSTLRRNRSRSDLTGEATVSGISDQWKRMGGPPVPNINSPQDGYGENENSLHGYSDAEGEDDDDDDHSFGGGLLLDQLVGDEKPNQEVFKQYVRKLNPQMGSNKHSQDLVNRLAQQQLARYKNLLGHRVKHQKDLQSNSCVSSAVCISQGKSAQAIEPKLAGRNARRAAAYDDGSDSNPDNKLGHDAFPYGIPRPPLEKLPARIECQLCFKTKDLQKPSDWTKHVHEDVQPFTCTFTPCKEPKSFKRKADWVRHENEIHRHLESWKCNLPDCTHVCHRKDNFLQHLVREHKMPEPKNKSKAAIQNAKGRDAEVWQIVESCHVESQAQSQDEPCKFCGKTFNTWKKLTVHEAKHMEQISLPIIGLVQKRLIDESTVISPVTPLPAYQPESPITTVMNTPSDSGSFMDMGRGFMQGRQNGQSASPYARQMHQGMVPMQQGVGFRQSTSNGYGNQGSTPSMSFAALPGNGMAQAARNPQYSHSIHTSVDMGTSFSNPFNNAASPIHSDHGPFSNFASGQLMQNSVNMMPIDPVLSGQQTYGSGSYASSAADISPNPGAGYTDINQATMAFSTQGEMYGGMYTATQPQMQQSINSFATSNSTNVNFGRGIQQEMSMDNSMSFGVATQASANMSRSRSDPNAQFQHQQQQQQSQQQQRIYPQQQDVSAMQDAAALGAGLGQARSRSTGSGGRHPSTYAGFGMGR